MKHSYSSWTVTVPVLAKHQHRHSKSCKSASISLLSPWQRYLVSTVRMLPPSVSVLQYQGCRCHSSSVLLASVGVTLPWPWKLRRHANRLSFAGTTKSLRLNLQSNPTSITKPTEPQPYHDGCGYRSSSIFPVLSTLKHWSSSVNKPKSYFYSYYGGPGSMIGLSSGLISSPVVKTQP